MKSYPIQNPHRIQISVWLMGLCLLVALTVVVGGITRLTNSGLSITEWKPLIGALPPLTESDWQEVFLKYQQIPEYRLEHPNMDIQGFKFIFFWEWGHRNLGRFIGLYFFIPFMIFSLQKKFDPTLRKRLLIGLSLGALQGLMGWVMVKSGLSERTDVSHYRLAMHLFLAFLIFSYFLRIILDLMVPLKNYVRSSHLKSFRLSLVVFHSLIGLQIIYGAFVAGLRAGHFFNTFPTMNGLWMPTEAFHHTPAWLAPFENPALVQFIHRWIGALVLIYAVVFVHHLKKARTLTGPALTVCWALTLAVAIQFTLGVLTLVLKMPLHMASFHQLGGLVVFGLLTASTHLIQKPLSN